MHDVSYAVVRVHTIGVLSFNSLFEMHGGVLCRSPRLPDRFQFSIWDAATPHSARRSYCIHHRLSILYLRCKEDAKVALRYRDVIKPFNSLFEMLAITTHNVYYNNGGALSILYLRCLYVVVIYTLMRMVAKLSILYLRCRNCWQALPCHQTTGLDFQFSIWDAVIRIAKDMGIKIIYIPFNSLFEMHGVVFGGGRCWRVALSILYLRCPRGCLCGCRRIRHTLSILYLRCTPKDLEIIRRTVEKCFQFSIWDASTLCASFTHIFSLLSLSILYLRCKYELDLAICAALSSKSFNSLFEMRENCTDSGRARCRCKLSFNSLFEMLLSPTYHTPQLPLAVFVFQFSIWDAAPNRQGDSSELGRESFNSLFEMQLV